MRPFFAFFASHLSMAPKIHWMGYAWGCVMLVLIGVFTMLFCQGYRQKCVFEDRLARDNARLFHLNAEISKQEAYLDAILRDPLVLEKVARERLGYAKDDEIVIRFRSVSSD